MALISALIVTTLVLNCTSPLAQRNGTEPPLVRIGIVERKSAAEFKISGQVRIHGQDGNFTTRGQYDGHWRVEVHDSEPAKFIYRLALATTKDRYKAEEIVRSVAEKGLAARIETYRRTSEWSLPYVGTTVYQVVLNKEFKSEAEAKSHQQSILVKTGSEVIEVPTTKAEGVLRFTNLDNQHSFEARKPVSLTASNIEVLSVDVGSGFHWESSADRTYNGSLEFVLDDFGLVTVVNKLSLEDYLKGVVPSEMPVGFPFEALKAQAVTARVEAIAKTGLRHPLEPFDLCDDVHCQVFSGTSKLANATTRAVESTRGIFMIHRKNITEAFYAGVCGGHTENNENVWLMDSKGYLRGILDSEAKRLSSSLQSEDNVRRWVDSKPAVFCNTNNARVPKSLNYSKKYFRWKVKYSRKELESIIREKTGEDFGDLVDLLPKKRGVSGRLIELEVVGTRKRFIISRELAIRQALSKNTLYSACFYLKKKGTSNGLPQEFIINGAGWGHGVGMCQIGAAVMAHRGKKFDEILTHYYRRVVLEILYN